MGTFARRLLTKLDFEAMKFSLLFLGMVDPASVPEDPKDRVRPWSARVQLSVFGIKPVSHCYAVDHTILARCTEANVSTQILPYGQ